MSTDLNILGVIPARYTSTRFPGKPLKEILGKPIIQYVWEGAKQSKLITRVVVATDDERIKVAVESFGGEAMMTSPDHKTGTDRVAEVARKIEADLVVNIQGDEPLIRGDIIDQAVWPLVEDSSIPMGTICAKIKDDEELNSRNIVKVIVDKKGFAIYFSRLPIPFLRDGAGVSDITSIYRKHIGLYVYRADFLPVFNSLQESVLEQAEKLEQLRAIENGYRIRVVFTDYEGVGIDTPEDLETAEKILRGKIFN
ncbi:MAG: 3-deoxy-manno-octulosonate cytidylyltransferase [Nitrospinota bacterium]|nr:3-deoxy-manno-octulosonate cytidylyltransferase [Nitrospinota bacterium]